MYKRQIQIGAVAAQGLSRFMGRTRMEERYLITAGAGAGLAAAFNAPVAGMMFALEELHRNFSGAVLLPTMAAAVSATIVSRLFFGSSTSFLFPSLVRLPSEYLVYVIFIAVTCGIGGIIFNYGLLHTDKFYGLPVFKNQSVKILFALLTAAVLGLCLPQVLGGGNTPVSYTHLDVYKRQAMYMDSGVFEVLDTPTSTISAFLKPAGFFPSS